MAMQRWVYRLLKKLPLLLALLMTPVTIYLVVTHNDSIRGHLGLSDTVAAAVVEPEAPPPIIEEKLVEPKLPEDPAVERPPAPVAPVVSAEEPQEFDWKKAEAGCSSAEEFAALAKKAKAEKREDLARRYYLEALHLDANNAEAHLGVGDLLFDPAEYLVEFKAFEGRQLEGWLASFRERKGTWVSAIELEKIKAAWEPVRAELAAELALQGNDPFEELRRRHVRLSMMRYPVIEQFVKKNNYWIDRSRSPYFIFVEGDRVDEGVALAPSLDRLCEYLESVHASFKSQHGIEATETPELFFVWILKTKQKFKAWYGGRDRAEYDIADRALHLHTRDGLVDFAGKKANRDKATRAFTQMLLDHYSRRPAEENPPAHGDNDLLTLEEHIRTQADDASAPGKQQELADRYLQEAYTFQPEEQSTEAEELEALVKTTRLEYLQKAYKHYEALVKIQAKKANEDVDAIGLLRLKAGVTCWLWQSLLTKREDRKKLLRSGEAHLYEALWELPPRDPLLLWAWLYTYLTSAELGHWPQCWMILEGAFDPDKQVIDPTATLSAAGESASQLTGPLGALLYFALERADEEERPKIRDYAAAFTDVCAAAGVAPGMHADLLLLDTYNDLLNPKEMGRAGKLLIEVAGRNPGNAVGSKARPLLEAWGDAPAGDKKTKYSFYPEVVLALADELRAEGDYPGALARYQQCLDLASAKYSSQRKLVKKLGSEVQTRMALCTAALEAPSSETGLPAAMAIDPSPDFLQTGVEIERPAIFYPADGDQDRAVNGVTRSVDLGLDWLVRHQSPEGNWDCDGFSSQCPKEDKCTGSGRPEHDLGVTGLALLALIKGQSTVSHQEAIKKGLRYVCRAQDFNTGSLTSKNRNLHRNYDHAIATLALIEAHAASPSPMLLAPIEKSLAWIHKLKNPGRAWRYNDNSTDPIEQNDVSVTGWMVRCLARAHACGFTGYEKDLEDALLYINEMTDSESGRTGYNRPNSYGAREEGDLELWPPDLVEPITAVAMVCRFLCGEVFDNEADLLPMQEKAAKLLRHQPPRWDTDGGTIDYYYWYYGSLAMHRCRGNDWQFWKKYLLKAVIDNQRREGSPKGSWDSQVDPFGDSGGRVYSTALCIMMLQLMDEP